MWKVVLRPLLPVFSVALVLGVAEASLRLCARTDDAPVQEHELGWASPEVVAFDPSEPSRPDQKRILFLGDSLIVPYTQRGPRQPIPDHLQSLVGDRAIVRSLATAGWGTDQELLAFVQKGVAYRPDLVLLMFCSYNDLSNNLSNRLGPRSPGYVKPYFRLERDQLVLYDPSGARAPQLDSEGRTARIFRSELASLITRAARRIRADDPETELPSLDPRVQIFKRKTRPYHELHGAGATLSWAPQSTVDHLSAFIDGEFELSRYQWELFDALIGELAARTRAIDSRLVLVLLPVPIPRFEHHLNLVTGSGFRQRFETPDGPFMLDLSHPGRRLAEIAARHEIELFDPTEPFLAAVAEAGPELSRQIWVNNDPHLSGPGDEMLAHQLRSYLGDWLED